MATGARQLLSRVLGALTPFTPSGAVVLNEDGSFSLVNAGVGAALLKTIASGAIARTTDRGFFKVAGEGASADNLDSITGGVEGDIIVLRPSSDTVDITLRDKAVSTTGNIRTPAQASIVLAEDDDHAVLVFDGTNWNVVAFKTQAKDIGTARVRFFKSTEQTGTGSSQDVAHGLGATPGLVMIFPSDTAPATTGAYTMVEGAHDATNVKVTVTTGKKFLVVAIAP